MFNFNSHGLNSIAPTAIQTNDPLKISELKHFAEGVPKYSDAKSDTLKKILTYKTTDLNPAIFYLNMPAEDKENKVTPAEITENLRPLGTLTQYALIDQNTSLTNIKRQAILLWLIQHQGDLEIKNQVNETPLEYYFSKKDTIICMLLIKLGAEITKGCCTYIINLKWIEMLHEVLPRLTSEKINNHGHRHETFLDYAQKQKADEIIDIIIADPRLDIPKALGEAFSDKNNAVFQKLLSRLDFAELTPTQATICLYQIINLNLPEDQLLTFADKLFICGADVNYAAPMQHTLYYLKYDFKLDITSAPLIYTVLQTQSDKLINKFIKHPNFQINTPFVGSINVSFLGASVSTETFKYGNFLNMVILEIACSAKDPTKLNFLLRIFHDLLQGYIPFKTLVGSQSHLNCYLYGFEETSHYRTTISQLFNFVLQWYEQMCSNHDSPVYNAIADNNIPNLATLITDEKYFSPIKDRTELTIVLNYLLTREHVFNNISKSLRLPPVMQSEPEAKLAASYSSTSTIAVNEAKIEVMAASSVSSTSTTTVASDLSNPTMGEKCSFRTFLARLQQAFVFDVWISPINQPQDTLLHIACSAGDEKAVLALLKHAPHTQLQRCNAKGETPLACWPDKILPESISHIKNEVDLLDIFFYLCERSQEGSFGRKGDGLGINSTPFIQRLKLFHQLLDYDNDLERARTTLNSFKTIVGYDRFGTIIKNFSAKLTNITLPEFKIMQTVCDTFIKQRGHLFPEKFISAVEAEDNNSEMVSGLPPKGSFGSKSFLWSKGERGSSSTKGSHAVVFKLRPYIPTTPLSSSSMVTATPLINPPTVNI